MKMRTMNGNGHNEQGTGFKSNGKAIVKRSNGATKPPESRAIVTPRSINQRALLEAFRECSVTLVLGPAGSGKTYLACAAAVEALEAGEVERIVLTRPAVEAGERLGYLPGDMLEKMAPYMGPLYDNLTDLIGAKRLRSLIAEGVIEIAPIGFMRGRTLNNAFIVIDEAQNCTYTQMTMLLTRLGLGSRMAVTGDPEQSDLPKGESGFAEVAEILAADKRFKVVRLEDGDIVRHPLVKVIVDILKT